MFLLFALNKHLVDNCFDIDGDSEVIDWNIVGFIYNFWNNLSIEVQGLCFLPVITTGSIYMAHSLFGLPVTVL